MKFKNTWGSFLFLRNNRKFKIRIYWALFLVFWSCQSSSEWHRLQGAVFGTFFDIKWQGDPKAVSLEELETLFEQVNASISTYRENSLISLLNAGESIILDSIFLSNFQLSKELYQKTEHYFNPAVEPLFLAYKNDSFEQKSWTEWSKIIDLDRFIFDSLFIEGKMQYRLISQADQKLNFNAIGKGGGVDLVHQFLKSKGLVNYLINIGGELYVSGKKDNDFFTIGIESPQYFIDTAFFAHVKITQPTGIATSGNYRQFLEKDGVKESHILDPTTGKSSPFELQSVSVFHPQTAVADAYATALMAMGKEKALDFAKKMQTPVFLIFEQQGSWEYKAFHFDTFPLEIQKK